MCISQDGPRGRLDERSEKERSDRPLRSFRYEISKGLSEESLPCHSQGRRVIHAPLGLSTTSAEQEKAGWRDALAAVRHDVQEVMVDGDVEMPRVVVTGTVRTRCRAKSQVTQPQVTEMTER